jgi:hypothetical protein
MNDDLTEPLEALERAKAQTAYAYEFVPNSYSYHAHVACLHAHRIVAAVAARLQEAEAA